MQYFNDLIKLLEKIPENDFVSKAAAILQLPVNWSQLIYDYLYTMSQADFYYYYTKGCAHDTSPEIFLLHDDPNEKFRVAINYFDKHVHTNHFKNKKITPHMHHFSFATRILEGNYLHWIYQNSGTIRHPKLTLTEQSSCQKDDIYTLSYDIFHIVLGPAHETISLMIRGPTTLKPKHLRFPLVTTDVLRRKEVILKKLQEARCIASHYTGNLLNLNLP
jgi:hypothetical protein